MKLYFLSVCLFLGFLLVSCHDNSTKERPNIIIINVDDLGWKDLGYTGSRYYETPNIDRLAQSGIQFTNGYAAAANCAPSRACLMTGRWTPRHGIYTVASSERGNSKDRKLIPVPNIETLSRALPVLPAILNENGYITCHAGKWHLSSSPLDYGFEVNIGGGHAGHPRSYYPPFGNVDIPGFNNLYLTDAIMSATLEFIDTVQQPFFLNYAPYAVHTPIQPVQELLPKYEEKAPWNGQKNADYATMVENLDKNIGLMITALQQSALLDNTIIVFTSDNGGLYGITMQKPLRAGKGSYNEGGIRVPFFVVWEGCIGKNTTSDVPVSNIDLFPTLLRAAGIDPEEYTPDGMDLMPVLVDGMDGPDRALYWHFPVYLQAYNVHDNENRDSLFRTRPGSAIRKGNWKLHYYYEDDGIELYNLEEDISEINNLAGEYPGKTDELLSDLQDWWKLTGAPIPSEFNPEYKDPD